MEFSNGVFTFSGREATVLGLNRRDKEPNQPRTVQDSDIDIADIGNWHSQRENAIQAFEECCQLPAGPENKAIEIQRAILKAHRDEAAVLIAQILSLKDEHVELEQTYRGDPSVELHNYSRGAAPVPFAF